MVCDVFHRQLVLQHAVIVLVETNLQPELISRRSSGVPGIHPVDPTVGELRAGNGEAVVRGNDEVVLGAQFGPVVVPGYLWLGFATHSH